MIPYLVLMMLAALAATVVVARTRAVRTARGITADGSRQPGRPAAGPGTSAHTPERHLQTQEMEAVGQLAAEIAHGLNDTLTAIIGHTELLLGTLPPDDPGVVNAREIRRGALGAAQLTRQLLALSRNQPTPIEVIDVNAVAARTAASLRRLDGSPASGGAILVDGYATVLIVDDDRRVRDLAKLVLVRAGYDVVAVAGPHDALAALRRRPDIKLLLIDVVMPEMNGYDLALEARKIAPGALFVFMSGFACDTRRQTIADGFLAKPFTIETLIDGVRPFLPAGRPRAALDHA